MSANKKLDELTVGSAISDDDTFYSVQGGTSVQVGSTAVLDYVVGQNPTNFVTIKVGTTPDSAQGGLSGIGSTLMSQEIARFEKTNTNTSVTDGYFGADDITLFVRTDFKPTANESPLSYTRQSILGEAHVPIGAPSVGVTIVGLQGLSWTESTNTVSGNLTGVFSDVEHGSTAVVGGMRGFECFVEKYAGGSVTNDQTCFYGTSPISGGGTVGTQMGLFLSASGGTITDRYQIFLDDATGTVTGDNYGIYQAGTTGNRRNLFEAGLMIPPANLANQANDAGAAGAGVPVGGFYRNGSVLMIRVT